MRVKDIMGLDTFYRPKTYSEVLGQQAIISVLRQVVIEQKGFRQSYCFSGPFGTGKTTLARIFAKSLLCETPKDGEYCGECNSCVFFKEGKSHPDLTEVDAASSGRKEDIDRILEEIKYHTFSGRRRIYIIDESHELSKAAMDGLLFPLENTIPGSEDKQLVCIFCTTDPSKMRSALLSRCAPSFSVGVVPPESIANRLQHICDDQKISYEREALILLAELCESHVRDCIKAVDILSDQGGVTREVVLRHMHQNHNDLILDLLLILDSEDQSKIPHVVDQLLGEISPSFIYRKIAEICILAFRADDKFKIPSYYNSSKIRILHQKGVLLLQIARTFSSRPYNIDRNTLICDLYFCTQIKSNIPVLTPSVKATQETSVKNGTVSQPGLTGIGVYIDPSARKKSRTEPKEKTSEKPLNLDEAKQLLASSLGVLNGSTGPNNMGSS